MDFENPLNKFHGMDSLVDCQGAQEEPEGRQGGPGVGKYGGEALGLRRLYRHRPIKGLGSIFKRGLVSQSYF